MFDEDFKAVYDAASELVRDFIDLLYLTGQRPSDVLKMSRKDIQDGVLYVRQGKTDEPIRMAIKGRLTEVIERITARKVTAMRLVVAEDGQPLALRGIEARFRKAARSGGSKFQLRDLRAKAGTDKAEKTGDIRKAQAQLGHTSVKMSETYIRSRGETVDPTE